MKPMLLSSISLWSLLVIIGVSDAREHRIPNSLIIYLIVVTILEVLLINPLSDETGVFVNKVYGLLLCFVAGLVCYICRVMAAGDVKLLSAIGFILGVEQLLNFSQFAAWSCGTIGIMYLSLNRLDKTKYQSSECNLSKRNETTHMPFAPILVVGLAMYQYSNLS